MGIAGGSGVVGQKLLEAIFGEDAVRRMAAGARTRLEERMRELLVSQQERFTQRLDEASGSTDPETPSAADLTEAAQILARAGEQLASASTATTPAPTTETK